MSQTFCMGYGNLIHTAIFDAFGSWQTGAPASNLATWGIAETAVSVNATTTSTRVRFHYSLSSVARALVIMGHNLSAAATVRWLRGTASSLADVSDVTVNAWRFTPRRRSGEVFDVQILLPAATSAFYDEIQITDTGNVSGRVELGRVFIGPVFEPLINPEYGLRDGHMDRSRLGVAYSGANWPNADRRPRQVKFALPWLELVEGDLAHEIEQNEGTTDEIAYLPYTDDPARMQQYGFVGQMQELSGIEYPRTLMRGTGYNIIQRV